MSQFDQGLCKHRIKASYHEFRAKEKVIADYIMEHPEKIIHSSISQVADNLNVAEATVFRFCKRIGFKGYQAMKIALASEVVNDVKDIHEKIHEDDDEKSIAEKVFKSNIRTLEDTLSVMDADKMKQAVDILCNAQRIEFYGNGGSGVIAQDAHHKFIRTGIPSAAYSDSHLQMMSASQLTSKDAVVLISHSGANRDILQTLEVAQEHGVPTIGITSLAKSPLSEQVDVALFTLSEETEYRSEALASRLAQLSLIDALYVNVSIRKKEQMQESVTKMRQAISRTRM
ncbi:MurR/RpiR family transcriptional regulator [Paenalkalicoccus suaedae]|uniref:MurR/RpiR family transcriptional regulator n=1 Tax=Paenalkalicoccus suaedae TaxID=2592382 RepID=A0A859FIT7_9BACI|nr:MurR/RpiR family transcriptional regulator [Paenalkalicoccus suaedae]QKS72724.1 MurR/RpiR family transcriptional regulator [Paenalkalicoccus suaedae]